MNVLFLQKTFEEIAKALLWIFLPRNAMARCPVFKIPGEDRFLNIFSKRFLLHDIEGPQPLDPARYSALG